ncbi:GntR family transcriptional regulator [Arthrobacter sp. NQ7]|uniref:GntR family transcriptional regulator n=1 Tax=Arthrobacter sp. NQ7 TaxID=3032303 RepID=UPI00240F6B8D|nr:GntR family transcriptional regulator [Arthrobacter sp. NQ7]MDJ0459839.1 GntR family transcriptional regulator [Arthrobacter sp. NQ7]
MPGTQDSIQTDGESVAATSTAHRLLFGGHPPVDASTVVVRRVKTAIGLGLLVDGDRLPSESDMAQQLGVTNWSLRDALAALREQGLIITRKGKNGGSFVKRPEQVESLGGIELERLSAVDLRDLSDWRRMLLAEAASLAASRATEADVTVLKARAEDVASAPDPFHARRAYGRFRVDLAVAAQSLRLSNSEFAAHEDADLIFGLLFSDDSLRLEISARLGALAAAVERRDPEQARSVAHLHSQENLASLLKLRLTAIAEGAKPSDQRSLEDEIRSLGDFVLTQLGRVAETSGPFLAQGDAGEQARRAIADMSIREIAQSVFPLDGLGIVAEVGVLPEHPYWLAWWHRTAAGVEQDNRHILDPEHPYFYDYQDREWMTHPRSQREPWATGPYIDRGGADDFLISITHPIVHSGSFLGISGADVRVSELERYLAPWLSARPVVVLNAAKRVVVSSSVEFTVGDSLPEDLSADAKELGIFGWSVLYTAH